VTDTRVKASDFRQRLSVRSTGKARIRSVAMAPALFGYDLVVSLPKPAKNVTPTGSAPAPAAKIKGRGTKAVREQAPKAPKVPMWQRIVELGKSVPASEWTNVPKDLAANVDHYLYGAQKKST
jgi:hypothetical protein